ncbi:MAG: dehydrogenase [Pelagibacteraceae bacterium TMED65]|nr:MAG: dehydrogenase [Pelagibacteraceae bacterium TMED65]
MKQLQQNLGDGTTALIDVPCPSLKEGHVLIKTVNSLVSVGTEKMLINFGKAGYLKKASQQPEKLKAVVDKINTDGLLPTFKAVQSKLNKPISLGYCNAGIVVKSESNFFEEGDRVISNGSHAELVVVPQNLCAKIPHNVDDETAAFCVLASVGMQGIRLADPKIGETVCVFGLGLVGLLTVQILIANGCRVLAIDMNSKRCQLARKFGAQTVDLSKNEDPISHAKIFSRGNGIDAVIIAASTKKNDVIHLAAEISRKRGRVILIGVVGLNLRREDFFKKEITFMVAASYGPGRYDPNYEERGEDYPLGFVRWTARRNFEAVLDLMSSGSLNLKSLITHRFQFNDALKAYEKLEDLSALGVLLCYQNKPKKNLTKSYIKISEDVTLANNDQKPGVSFIGAGSYASSVLIPSFKKTGVSFDAIVCNSGSNGIQVGKKAGFRMASTDFNSVINRNSSNVIVIATPHNVHASQVISALKCGKHVFVEKPLALKISELVEIKETYTRLNRNRSDLQHLMVGFNRRFSPLITKMKGLIEKKREPKAIIITVNAGSIPFDHWIHSKDVGGGRIIGEGCHFVDLLRFLVGVKIKSFQVAKLKGGFGADILEDNVTINLLFHDGSVGTIHYLANGNKSFPKERVEVFCGNAVLQLDNYKILKGFGWNNFKRKRLFVQNKGQIDCVKAFVDSIQHKKPTPIPFDELIESSETTIQISNELIA